MSKINDDLVAARAEVKRLEVESLAEVSRLKGEIELLAPTLLGKIKAFFKALFSDTHQPPAIGAVVLPATVIRTVPSITDNISLTATPVATLDAASAYFKANQVK